MRKANLSFVSMLGVPSDVMTRSLEGSINLTLLGWLLCHSNIDVMVKLKHSQTMSPILGIR